MDEQFEAIVSGLENATDKLQQQERDFANRLEHCLESIRTREQAVRVAGIVAGRPQMEGLILALQVMAKGLPA